ncbi:hypothetical protein PPH41_09130, partial [Burkholderia gladioli]|nr:hypothetical protein [Burkholderia gladioli]
MVRKVFPDRMATRHVQHVRQAHWRALAPAFAACVAFALSAAASPARAAMNFCAAPALQSNESTSAEPGIQALVRSVDAHLNDAPKALVHLHTEGLLPHEGIRDQSEEAVKTGREVAQLGGVGRLPLARLTGQARHATLGVERHRGVLAFFIGLLAVRLVHQP